MSGVRATPRRQRGDINAGTAVAITVLLVALLAWWMYWPETIPVFGKRPEAGAGKSDARGGRDARDARDPRDAQHADEKHARADANPPLYKWKDEHGQWHITDRAPKDRPYEKVVVDPGANVIPAEVPELSRDEDKDKSRPPH